MSTDLHIVCYGGTREKLQVASMMASVGAACGYKVNVFISMDALLYFVKDSNEIAPAAGKFGKLMEEKNVPPFKTLFQQAAELGDVQLLPCSMAMDLLEVTEDELDDELGSPIGLTKFLSDSESGRTYTF